MTLSYDFDAKHRRALAEQANQQAEFLPADDPADPRPGHGAPTSYPSLMVAGMQVFLYVDLGRHRPAVPSPGHRVRCRTGCYVTTRSR